MHGEHKEATPMAQHCIHVRNTTEGPALGLTCGDQSQLCSKVVIRLEDSDQGVAVITAGADGVTVTVEPGYEALVG